jgi:hypothetical protein
MKKIVQLLLFLTLAGCLNLEKSAVSIPEADVKLTQEWMYAEKLDDLKYNGEILLRPPGVEQLVMSLTIPNVGGVSSKRHCVYYQIPYKEKPGRLLVMETKSEVVCPDVSNEDKLFLFLDNIQNLKITFANFKLSLNFDSVAKKQLIEIPLPNIEQGLVHEKYRPLKEKRMISGLKFLRLSDESFDTSTNKYLGKLTDRFSNGNAIRCHQVNKDCETIGENRCDQCRYGWYEVVDFQCSQGGSKFCGQNHCGEKNEPACPRGEKVVDPKDVEEAGICQSDLEATPNLEKILVCQ